MRTQALLLLGAVVIAGWSDLIHAQTEWSSDDRSRYGAYVLDPDGHNIEAVCREGE